MAKDKRSFFERLTGTVKVDGDEDAGVDFEPEEESRKIRPAKTPARPAGRSNGAERPVTASERAVPERRLAEQTESEWLEENAEEGQLTVDVYQTANEIVIKTIVAGVRPDDLDVNITRDMVVIRGRREEAKESTEDDYFHRELYWGAFSRTILLPEEIDVEAAEATQNHGLLTIRLPKIDKRRQTKLRVKVGG
jgi:HSP20 family protein